MALTTRDLRAVLDVVGIAHTGEGELPGEVLPEIARLVGGEVFSFNQLDPGTGHLLNALSYPQEPNLSQSARFRQMMSSHPGYAAYRNGLVRPVSSVALSDLADRKTLHSNDLFAEYYYPRGTRDQLFNAVRVTARYGAVFTVNRARRGYSHRDRAVMDALAPHLGQALAYRSRITELTAAVRSVHRQATRLDQAVAGLDSLTTRERDVVAHVLNGDTDRDIARALGIGLRTVHKHLEQIYRKLRISNRTSLIAAVHRSV